MYTVDETAPGGMCLGAWEAIAPYLFTLRYDGDLPWESDKGYRSDDDIDILNHNFQEPEKPDEKGGIKALAGE